MTGLRCSFRTPSLVSVAVADHVGDVVGQEHALGGHLAEGAGGHGLLGAKAGPHSYALVMPHVAGGAKGCGLREIRTSHHRSGSGGVLGRR